MVFYFCFLPFTVNTLNTSAETMFNICDFAFVVLTDRKVKKKKTSDFITNIFCALKFSVFPYVFLALRKRNQRASDLSLSLCNFRLADGTNCRALRHCTDISCAAGNERGNRFSFVVSCLCCKHLTIFWCGCME